MRASPPTGSVSAVTTTSVPLLRVPRPTCAGLATAARFALVGVSGYVINVAVFTVLVRAVGVNCLPAGAAAFLAAVINNFVWNRRWTFRAPGGTAIGQALRFLTVSTAVLGLTLALLSTLLGHGLSAVPAQALATAMMTPLAYTANRLWTFPAPPHPPAEMRNEYASRRQ